ELPRAQNQEQRSKEYNTRNTTLFKQNVRIILIYPNSQTSYLMLQSLPIRRRICALPAMSIPHVVSIQPKSESQNPFGSKLVRPHVERGTRSASVMSIVVA
ncbi:25514_t:CDS:2, partial [Racocetra persica]